LSPFRITLLHRASLASRLLLGGIFLYAGLIKAGASEEFAVALAPFTILPGWGAAALARFLPWVEIAAGALILTPRAHRAGSLLILTLCLLFAAALLWALANGIVVSCGCFGGDAPPSATAMLAAALRDLALATLALFTLTAPGRARARTPP